MAAGSIEQDVQTFGTTTKELLALSDWLTAHAVTHVAMEATGVYWKPVWHVLDGHFELILANASHIKNVPGRKTDVNDAMWIADLLAHGLIRASFVRSRTSATSRERASSSCANAHRTYSVSTRSCRTRTSSSAR
jgi:transposase